MAKVLVLTVLLANLLASNCQVEEIVEDDIENQIASGAKPSYSFSYGVSDARTGDIKTVWESKEGDTVKGHYSVLEPDGSMRTVEYSATPDTGFKAVVNTESATLDTQGSARSLIEDKAMRDYEKYYDFPEEEEGDYIDRKKVRRPHERYQEHSRRRPQYPDLEPSEYTHSISIKHPYDESLAEDEPHSHVGYSFDANCKTKHKKESNENRDNWYASLADVEPNKHKYSAYSPDTFKENYNKFAEPTDYDFEKAKFGYNDNFKSTKFDDVNIKPASSMKYNYPALPEIPPPDRYENDNYHPPRPKKKKHRPHKQPNYHYSGEDMDEYVLVPKKKYKPSRIVEHSDYRPELDDDYERPHYNNDDDQDDRFQNPPRATKPKEVVRKIVTKRRPPVINLLDIFDI